GAGPLRLGPWLTAPRQPRPPRWSSGHRRPGRASTPWRGTASTKDGRRTRPHGDDDGLRHRLRGPLPRHGFPSSRAGDALLRVRRAHVHGDLWGRSRGGAPLREGRPGGGAVLPRRGGVHAHLRGGADVDAHRLGVGVASAPRPVYVLGPPRRVCARLAGEHPRPGRLRTSGGADVYRLRFPNSRCPFPAYGVCPHVHPVPGLRSDASRRRHADRRPGPRPGDGHPRYSVVVRYSRGPRLPLTAGRPDDSLVETGDCPPGGSVIRDLSTVHDTVRPLGRWPWPLST